ncbi:MAG: tRNA 4-thiouridine(8) synthase ThiI [Oscillospiraceae bacterium]|nr:tRNA 4-thiouridine(8) synthase ThiI [Oscillospiraceae bacterium]
MRKVLLAKYGEMALKGLNKSTFEDILIKNIKSVIKDCGEFEIKKAQSTIYILPADQFDTADEFSSFSYEDILEKVSKVFGIAALCIAWETEKEMGAVRNAAIKVVSDRLNTDKDKPKTFKAEAKRSDKLFPLKSPQICAEIGNCILDELPNMKVDVHDPDITVTIEIRDFGAYIHSGQIPGAGGLPLGSSGKALVLLSGGIDSPVAAYMMAKRGIALEALHFSSPPYTSGRALEKVVMLCRELSEYTGSINLHVAEFTGIQQAIQKNCAEEYATILTRRMMMRTANNVAKRQNLKAIITGESVAQVASQTLDALICVDVLARFPVLRPVAGMDKNQIIEIARKIGTYETSILPYEDCCTVFTPKHPKTRPSLEAVMVEEQKLNTQESSIKMKFQKISKDLTIGY